MKILLSWTGKDTDPHFVAAGDGGVAVGAHFQFLSLPEWQNVFDLHILFAAPLTRPDGEALKAALKRQNINIEQEIRTLDLDDPTDYGQIRKLLTKELVGIREQFTKDNLELTVLLTPGTPQMRTTWFALAALGTIKAQLIETVALEIAEKHGVPAWKEIDVSEVLALDELLPTPPEAVGDEQAEQVLPPLDTSLHAQVKELENRLICETLDACKGNQSETARRLGIDRNTLRAKLKDARP